MDEKTRNKSVTPPRPSLPDHYTREMTPTSSSSGSLPPRPSLPDNYIKELTPSSSSSGSSPPHSLLMISKRGSIEEPLPPRPPPPFQYTSTLPPPAPKKQRSKSNDFKSKTLPLRKSQSRVQAEETQNMSGNVSSSDQCGPVSTPTPAKQGVTLEDNSKCPDIKNTTPNNQPESTDNNSDVKEDNIGQTSNPVTIFINSFRKASQSPLTLNSLSAIGGSENQVSVISANGLKQNMKDGNIEENNVIGSAKNPFLNNEYSEYSQISATHSITEEQKNQVGEEKRKRKNNIESSSKVSCNDEHKASSCSPPSKRCSIENVKNVSALTVDESKKTRSPAINMTNCEVKQKPSIDMSNSSQQLMKNSKHPIASESLASRAKNESQEQLRKFKKNVSSMDDCKTKSSILHTEQYCHESKQSVSPLQRISTGSESSVTSLSERKSPDKKQIKSLKEQSNRMSPVLAIKNIMRKSDKDTKQKKFDKANSKNKKEAPIVLEDKYSRVLIKTGKRSPTPSLASTSSSSADTSRTLTPLSDRSSYAPSNLSLLSELLSDHNWLTPGQNNFSGIEDLDKYVMDMMAFTQNIETPRASSIKGSKKSGTDDLVKILSQKKRQSTNLEMKKQLQVIIDFVEDKKQSVSPERLFNLKYGVQNFESSFKTEEAEDYFMDCHNEERKVVIKYEESSNSLERLNVAPVVPLISVSIPPIPSPRFKRKNRIDGSSPTPSSISNSSRLLRSDSRVSLNSFSSFIHEIHQHTLGIDEKISDSLLSLNTKDSSFCETWIKSMKEKVDNLIKDKEEANKKNEELISQAEKLKSLAEIHEKEKTCWNLTEKEMKKNIVELGTTLLEEQDKNKEIVEEVKQRNVKLAEIFSSQKKEKETWKLIENEMKKNIIEIGNDLLLKSKELEEALNQSKLKDENIKEAETKLHYLALELDKREELICLKKQELNEKQTDINCLNGLVLKLNEDIDKLKSQQISSLVDGNVCSKENLQTCLNQGQNSSQCQSDHELREENKKLKELDEQISCLVTEKEEIILAHKRVKEHLEEELKNEKMIVSKLEEKNQSDNSLSAESKAKDDIIVKLRGDLKKRGLLLKEAQSTIEKLQQENGKRSIINHMKNQIEDLEYSNLSLSRAKKCLENDLEDMRIQFEDVTKSNSRLEERHLSVTKENLTISNQLEDIEEEFKEILKKYKEGVTKASADKTTIQDQSFTITELEHENERLKEKNKEQLHKIELLESDAVELNHQRNAKLKITELEQKLSLEQTNKYRLEHQAERMKDTVHKLEEQAELLQFKYQTDQEKFKKQLNQFRDLKEDYLSLKGKECDTSEKCGKLQKKLDIAEAENIIIKKDLELAMRRIEDFHVAMNSELDSDSDTITYSDDEMFLSNSIESIDKELKESNKNQNNQD